MKRELISGVVASLSVSASAFASMPATNEQMLCGGSNIFVGTVTSAKLAAGEIPKIQGPCSPCSKCGTETREVVLSVRMDRDIATTSTGPTALRPNETLEVPKLKPGQIFSVHTTLVFSSCSEDDDYQGKLYTGMPTTAAAATTYARDAVRRLYNGKQFVFSADIITVTETYRDFEPKKDVHSFFTMWNISKLSWAKHVLRTSTDKLCPTPDDLRPSRLRQPFGNV